jgi:predicted DCC family thiol-disulfide oxidoreductase YuxK
MKPRTVTAAYIDKAPALPAAAPLVVFDGVCVLCSRYVQWVIARDSGRRFWFTPAQGPLGQLLYRELKLDAVEFETNLLIVDGKAYGKLEAFIEIAGRLGGVWRAAKILRLLPSGLRDLLYDALAANRYRVFGKHEVCWMPSPRTADRVV